MFAYVILGLVPPPALLQVQKWQNLYLPHRELKDQKKRKCLCILDGRGMEGGRAAPILTTNWSKKGGKFSYLLVQSLEKI